LRIWSNLQSSQACRIERKLNEIYLSDHAPVFVQLEL
jgi:exonuclease III